MTAGHRLVTPDGFANSELLTGNLDCGLRGLRRRGVSGLGTGGLNADRITELRCHLQKQ